MPINFDLLGTINQPKILGQIAPSGDENSGGGFGGLGDLVKGLGGLLGKGGTSGSPQAQTQPQQALMQPQQPPIGLAGALNQGIGMKPNLPAQSNPQKQALQGALNQRNFSLAQTMMGMNELKDKDPLTAFLAKSGHSVDPTTTPWCATFVNGVLSANGSKGSGSDAARSLLGIGTPTDKPTKGDIVVLSRDNDPNKGHTGFYAGTDEKGNVLVLGGNQNNSVSIQAFPAGRVLGYRTPPQASDIQKGIAPPNSNPALPEVMAGIAHVESGGDYSTMSKPSKNGDRAYGKYQIMGNNIPQWTTEALGHPMTSQQFLSNPQAQERVAAFKINQSLQQGYSPEDTASIWFSGRPTSKAGNSKDAYGTTVPQYINKFNKGVLQFRDQTGKYIQGNVQNGQKGLIGQQASNTTHAAPGYPNIPAFDPSTPVQNLSPNDINAIMKHMGGGMPSPIKPRQIASLNPRLTPTHVPSPSGPGRQPPQIPEELYRKIIDELDNRRGYEG